MKNILGFIRIIRPLNCFITFSSIMVAGIICSGHSISYKIIFAGLAGALVAAGGNVINDIFDVEIDRINRPGRVLPSGIIKKSTAFAYYAMLNTAAVVFSSLINTYSLLIVIISIVLVYIYSYRLKKIPLAGNVLVAVMTGLTFIFGGIAVGNIAASLIPAVFAFLINLIREIIKDIQDLDGDMKNKIYSFPAKYGINISRKLIYILTIILFIFTFIPFLFKLYRIEYFIIVMFTVNTGLFLLLKNFSGEITGDVISRGSFLLKVYMIFGLIAIYFGN